MTLFTNERVNLIKKQLKPAAPRVEIKFASFRNRNFNGLTDYRYTYMSADNDANFIITVLQCHQQGRHNLTWVNNTKSENTFRGLVFREASTKSKHHFHLQQSHDRYAFPTNLRFAMNLFCGHHRAPNYQSKTLCSD